jgi:hypothetical protein
VAGGVAEGGREGVVGLMGWISLCTELWSCDTPEHAIAIGIERSWRNRVVLMSFVKAKDTRASCAVYMELATDHLSVRQLL